MIVTLALLGLGACSVDRRSDQYARCKKPNDCPSRMCDRGWCLPVGDPGDGPDARQAVPIDAVPQPGGCPPACTRCAVGTCFIECDGPDSCPDAITCPVGWDCSVECQGDQSCAGGVSCGQAASCSVICEGAGACGAVTCGTGACDVECSGFGACIAIDCSDSCACDTSCDDGALCAPGCPNRGGTCQRGNECNSIGCSTC